MKKIGLLINPIAGMGGAVGLKGTDGTEILEEARRRGAIPRSEEKTRIALEIFLGVYPYDDYVFYAYSPSMGGNLCKEMGLPYVLGPGPKENSLRKDTLDACHWMKKEGVTLLLFSGGDGTARDLLISAVDLPVLGIPTGVKIHSSVFALTPRHGGSELSAILLQGDIPVELREVMDIDEDLFRKNSLCARLYGYLPVPKNNKYFQAKKSAGGVDETIALHGIAKRVVEDMEPDEYYFIGPGTTTLPILELLGIKGTLLGVDVLKNKKLILCDANEKDLLKILEEGKAKIVVSVIGGQGYVFGRGNQQFSPKVLQKIGKQGIQIIATANKLAALGGKPLLMDLGDETLEKQLAGFYPIPVDGMSTYVYRCSNEE